MSRAGLRRALVCATAVSTGVLGLVGVAEAAPSPSASGPTQHVIVLLKNQHADVPASAANAGRRAQVTNSDQAPLVARAKSHGGKDYGQ